MIPRKTRMKAMFACLSGSPPAENGPIRTDYVAYNDDFARGCSSAGRALESHSRGQGFESPQLHRSSFLEASRSSSRAREHQSEHSSALPNSKHTGAGGWPVSLLSVLQRDLIGGQL